MLAGWRHVGIQERLQRAVEVGTLAVPAVLGRVIGAFEVLDRRPNADETAVLVGAVAERRVARGAVECEVHFRAGAVELEPIDARPLSSPGSSRGSTSLVKVAAGRAR